MRDRNRGIPVTLDSVILVSAFLTRGGLTSDLLALCAESDEFDICLSEEIVEETRATLLTKPHLRRRYSYSDDDVAGFLLTVGQLATMTRPRADVRVVDRDPEDDVILATALAAGPGYLITRDAHLLDLGAHQDVRVMSPEEFMPTLRGAK